jgi:predicted AAA+ superfamily ATPase
MYPRALTDGAAEAREVVDQITESYLYKDLFALGAIRKPEVLEKLVQALALQVGNEVSYTELATLIGIQKETVERYIQVLESAFIVFRLSPFSRNLRKEIAKSRKIYFWDVGVRNSVIRNFNALDIRTDAGMLWENFIIAERLKYNHYRGQRANTFFWRTYSQQEIDYIEDRDGSLHAYEFKYGTKNAKIPTLFAASYPEASFELVNKENYEGFLGVPSQE